MCRITAITIYVFYLFIHLILFVNVLDGLTTVSFVSQQYVTGVVVRQLRSSKPPKNSSSKFDEERDAERFSTNIGSVT